MIAWEVAGLGSPLIAAFVDPFVTTTIDADGNVVRDASQVTREPDRPDPTDLRWIDPPNRGADYVLRNPAIAVELGAPMIEQPRERERLTEADIVDLMRHPLSGPPSGSSSGRKAKKPPKVKPTTNVEQPVVADAKLVSSFRISGLSRGVLDFYDRRPGKDRDVLRSFVGDVIRDASIVEVRGQPPRSERPIIVFGLSDPELMVLRRFRNAARIRLAEYAVANDPGRIMAVDRM